MTCTNCNDQQVIWVKDKFGRATCEPCPACNRAGNKVRKETSKFEKKNEYQRLKELYSWTN